DVSSQSTYTTISQQAYKLRYCVQYQGNSCPDLFNVLFSREPVTGQQRVDLLGVSSLLMIRKNFSGLSNPPPGWKVASRNAFAVLWTRNRPVPGAGSVAWTSPGTSVSAVDAGTTGTSFRVDQVPSGGGTVVLRLLDWPGYSTSEGSIDAPLDGY